MTDRGREANPEIWYYSNVLHIREDFPQCERRILRMPVGFNSPDIALRRHMNAVLEMVLDDGRDGRRLVPSDVWTRPVAIDQPHAQQPVCGVPSPPQRQAQGGGRGSWQGNGPG